jgi:hypothetical protein
MKWGLALYISFFHPNRRTYCSIIIKIRRQSEEISRQLAVSGRQSKGENTEYRVGRRKNQSEVGNRGKAGREKGRIQEPEVGERQFQMSKSKVQMKSK